MEYYPLVSVIILVFQNQGYLKKAIDSVLSQDYPELELFISDDASFCFNLNEIRNYIEINKNNNLKRVEVLVMPKNLGTVRHANFIASKTTGKYIRYLGADDEFYDEQVISDSVFFMQRTGTLVSTSLSIIVNNKGDKIRVFPTDDEVKKIQLMTPKQLYGEMVTHGNIIGAAGTILSRSFFDDLGGFDEFYQLMEDYPTWLRLLRQDNPIPIFKKITVKYRYIGNSTPSNRHKYFGLLLRKELGYVIEREVLPFKDLLTNSQYRYARFLRIRILEYSNYSIIKKIKFVFSFLDIIIWRRIREFLCG